MSRFILPVVVCFAALVAVPFVLGQNVPEPGPEHAELKKRVGTWDAAAKFGDTEMKGTMVYKMELGGLWLIGDYTSEGGEEFSGKSLDTYDPVKKKYINIWIDSMGTSPMITEGTYDAAGKVHTATGQGPGFDGNPAKFRVTNEIVNADKFIVNLFITVDGQEQPMGAITYTRRK